MADATRLVEASIAYGQMLAADALAATGPYGDDPELARAIERFMLRRGLTRSQRSWSTEYGRDQGMALAKMAAPIVRNAFWACLDDLHPITRESDGMRVPLIRGWADCLQAPA